MSMRLSTISIILCAFVAIYSSPSVDAKNNRYEKKNGPGLISEQFFTLLRGSPALGVATDKVRLESLPKDEVQGKNLVIISRKISKQKVAYGTIESTDGKIYTMYTTKCASLDASKSKTSKRVLSLEKLNKKVDKIYFPNKKTRKQEKEKIVKLLEELNK